MREGGGGEYCFNPPHYHIHKLVLGALFSSPTPLHQTGSHKRHKSILPSVFFFKVMTIFRTDLLPHISSFPLNLFSFSRSIISLAWWSASTAYLITLLLEGQFPYDDFSYVRMLAGCMVGLSVIIFNNMGSYTSMLIQV